MKRHRLFTFAVVISSLLCVLSALALVVIVVESDDPGSTRIIYNSRTGEARQTTPQEERAIDADRLASGVTVFGGPTAAFAILPAIWITRGARELGKASRARQGLCPKCGYNLSSNTSGVCPECGVAVSNRQYSSDVAT